MKMKMSSLFPSAAMFGMIESSAFTMTNGYQTQIVNNLHNSFALECSVWFGDLDDL